VNQGDVARATRGGCGTCLIPHALSSGSNCRLNPVVEPASSTTLISRSVTNLAAQLQDSAAFNMPRRTDGNPKPSARWGMKSALRSPGVRVSVKHPGPLILMVEDVEETRVGIEKLLAADGYRVDPARQEEDAVTRAMR
jgi:hypothetical protein